MWRYICFILLVQGENKKDPQSSMWVFILYLPGVSARIDVENNLIFHYQPLILFVQEVWPVLNSNLQYKMGQDFLDIWQMLLKPIWFSIPIPWSRDGGIWTGSWALLWPRWWRRWPRRSATDGTAKPKVNRPKYQNGVLTEYYIMIKYESEQIW